MTAYNCKRKIRFPVSMRQYVFIHYRPCARNHQGPCGHISALFREQKTGLDRERGISHRVVLKEATLMERTKIAPCNRDCSSQFI